MKTLMRSGCSRQSPGLQHGLVVVELAITLPLVLLIMLATAEVGRAIFQYTTLTKAVEAGSRYYASTALDMKDSDITTTQNLIVFGSPQAEVTTVLPGFQISDVTEVELAPGSSGTILPNHVRVSADYSYTPFVSGIPILGSIASFTMTATHTMRAL